jgi:two-component system sensor kinase FixL
LCGPAEVAVVAEALCGEPVEILGMDLDGLFACLSSGEFAAAILDIDMLPRAAIAKLSAAITVQPGSDQLPMLVVGERDALLPHCEALDFGWIAIVERPLHPLMLRRALKAILRGREWQKEGIAFARDVSAARAEHRHQTELLEASHSQQIADLEEIGRRLGQEIEERKRTEEALRESEQLYRYTVELSRQVVWTAEPGGPPTIMGTRLMEITGAPPEATFADIMFGNIHPDDHQSAIEAWHTSQSAGRAWSREFRLRVADGSYRTFMARTSPRHDDAGNLVRWYGSIEDIHDQTVAMEALRLAQERYRLASRATNDAIWDWNISTDQVAWSDAAAAYLGGEAHEQSSMQWWEQAIHPDDRERVVRSLHFARDSDKPRWSAAYRLRKVDGEYAYVYDRGFIIRDDHGKALRAVGAVVDLTERRRAEAELRRTQAELIHVSRVSAMGAMASTLAHELNQPLTAVTSYVRGSRRLLAPFEDPVVRQVCDALEAAEAGALRAGQIVRRLRELVARGAVTVGPEDLVKLVGDASVLAFVDEHLHGITHRISIDPDARWVEVDPIQIQQVLINLIRNAIQALQNRPKREVLISARALGDDQIEVSVADTGTGIDASVRDALFSPFHSTKSEGMGIGLSISRTIVEAHHGRIWAEDGANGGAVFRFTLPRAEPLEDDAVVEAEERRVEQRQVV